MDTITGELYDMDQYYLRAKSSDEAFKQFITKDNRHFSFADMDTIKIIISNVSTVHCGYLLILLCYMEYESGRLKLTRKELPRALGTSESTFIRLWKEMYSYGIISEKNGEFYVNPYFHFSGQPKHNRVIKLFKTTLKQLKDQLTASELGFLYKLLPYVHYDTNMICANPFTDPENIQFLNKTQIALLVGMDEKKTSKLLDKLRKIGVIAETIRQDDRRDRIFTMNPYVFFRKRGQPDDTLCGLFASTPYGK
ncbi:helix-turn-helix domain-containing protein [Neobacillus massiliamazoniensis]|nr:helix-turn-helix domain-containing protein [Neobacillus massiliamazoniensis]